MAASAASGGIVGGSTLRVSVSSCGETTTSALSSSKNSPAAASMSAFRTAKPSPALRAFLMTHMRIISAAARPVKYGNGV